MHGKGTRYRKKLLMNRFRCAGTFQGAAGYRADQAESRKPQIINTIIFNCAREH
jgi:hypothetical protein